VQASSNSGQATAHESSGGELHGATSELLNASRCWYTAEQLSSRSRHSAPALIDTSCWCEQVKRTCYAQSSQIRQIRKKMVEIMTREASSCDLKELVSKFIPESIGAFSPFSNFVIQYNS